MTPADYIDDSADCEDQACGATTVCQRFECQTWVRCRLVKPSLQPSGGYLICPKCGSSYGALKEAEGRNG